MSSTSLGSTPLEFGIKSYGGFTGTIVGVTLLCIDIDSSLIMKEIVNELEKNFKRKVVDY